MHGARGVSSILVLEHDTDELDGDTGDEQPEPTAGVGGEEHQQGASNDESPRQDPSRFSVGSHVRRPLAVGPGADRDSATSFWWFNQSPPHSASLHSIRPRVISSRASSSRHPIQLEPAARPLAPIIRPLSSTGLPLRAAVGDRGSSRISPSWPLYQRLRHTTYARL